MLYSATIRGWRLIGTHGFAAILVVCSTLSARELSLPAAGTVHSRPQAHAVAAVFPTPDLAPQPTSKSLSSTAAGAAEPFSAKLDQRPSDLVLSAAKAAVDVGLSDVVIKWNSVRLQMAADQLVIRRCSSDPLDCSSSAARRFIAIRGAARQKKGLALVGEVNRAVNLAIRPMSDLAQYGVEDYWASPLEALGHAAGDCEDYAIAKYALLTSAGFPERSIRLLLVHDQKANADHAVLDVYVAGQWRILDNRRLVMLKERDVREYQPLFALNEGVRRVYRYGASPVALNGAPAATPSSILSEP